MLEALKLKQYIWGTKRHSKSHGWCCCWFQKKYWLFRDCPLSFLFYTSQKTTIMSTSKSDDSSSIKFSGTVLLTMPIAESNFGLKHLLEAPDVQNENKDWMKNATIKFVLTFSALVDFRGWSGKTIETDAQLLSRTRVEPQYTDGHPPITIRVTICQQL